MQQSGRIRLGGGNVGSLTPDTILYGKATNITDINYNNITVNKLVFKEPLTFTNCNISGSTNTSNEITIDSNLIYYKNDADTIFQTKLIQGLGININDYSNISVNFTDGGWFYNMNNNYLYTNNLNTNIGIGLTSPLAKLHIYNNDNNIESPSFIIQNFNNSFNFSFTNDNYFSLNDKIKISNYALNNSLLIDNSCNIYVNSNLFISGSLNINNNLTKNKITINTIDIIDWLIDSNNIATKSFVLNNQILNNNTILFGIASNITDIDYNNITKNKLSFNSPLIIDNANSISINSDLLGWKTNIISNCINTSYNNYNLGIGNTNPLSYLHIGNYINNTNTNNDTSLIISKINQNNKNKNFKIGIDELFNFSIGNFNIDINCNLNNNWNKQLIINNDASANSIILDSYNNTNINTKLILNSNLIINNFSSIIFNNNFNINFDNKNNFNINNFFIINSSGNIGVGTSPNNLNKMIINGNLNILSNLNSLNIISSSGTINNLINSNLISSNINSSNINNSLNITTNNITINNLTNTSNINNSSLITTKNLNVSSSITTLNFNSINANIQNLISLNIETNILKVNNTLNTNNINITGSINTFRIIANNIDNSSLITTNNLNVNINANTYAINNSSLITTNDLTVNNSITTPIINTNTLNSTIINNSTLITTDTLNSTTIANSDIITTNSAKINSTLDVNIITTNKLNINNNATTNIITITNTATANILICNNNIRIGGNNTNIINSFLQIYDNNTSGKSSFIISGSVNNFRFGYDTNLNVNFILGSFNKSIWRQQLTINNNAPDNSFVINSSGNIGIGLNSIDNNNNNYKLNVNGNLNATNILQNGENLITTGTLNTFVNNSLQNYTNTTDLNTNFINKIYLNYLLDDNNNNLQNYINNFLTITSNVYSPVLRFPEKTYDPNYYTIINTLLYYFNSKFYAYKETIKVFNTDINQITTTNIYDIYSSSTTISINKAILFNYDQNNITFTSLWNKQNYDNNGIFNIYSDTTSNIVNSNIILKNFTYGDYIIIKLPRKLVLNKFRFYSIKDSLSYAPGNWKCIYSNDDDGNNWYELTDASLSSSSVRLNTQNYVIDINNNYYYEQKLNNNSVNCIYIGFIFNSLASQTNNYSVVSDIHLELSRIELFFNQIVQPIYISSNVLNNYLNNYSTIDLLNNKQDKLYFISPLSNNGNNVYIDPNFLLNNLGQIDTSSLTYIIQNYINSITNVWSPVNNSGTSIYYNNIGSVGIGTDNPNLNRYKLDVNGNINCTNININNTITTSIINATSLNGDGNNITNLNYLNILNKPNLSNVNNIIFDTFKNNFYSSNFNSTFSIGYNNYDNIYKLSVNGSIISENNINARNNIQETGINLIDKYLTIQNASSTYLNINGGSINNFLNIGINGYNDPNYKLIVNGNINCFSNINSLNYFINNINLKDIFLSSLDARNNYLSIISGGTINSNVIINANLSIGTNINNLYKLNVNGNINSFSNIYANNFIENSSNLRDKYLSIIDASNIYFRNIGGNIN